MRVALVCSEMVPFAKTGGLADVAGALPKYLPDNIQCICFLPYYRKIREGGHKIEDTGITFTVKLDANVKTGTVLKTVLPGTNVPVYLIANDEYFDRSDLYGTSYGDYPDNSSRFIFYSRGVIEAIKALRLKLDVVHCHDWQTSLVPIYLKTLYRGQVPGNPATLLTIHNLAYQGSFWHWDMKLTGLEWELFNWRQLEFYGNLNFLKGGIVFSEALNTVSPTYAQEIQTPEFGSGLQEVLRFRSDRLFGIINGIDYDVWNPKTDSLLPFKYHQRAMGGKTKNKKALQKEACLPVNASIPIIGMISRLADQKGLDIIASMLDRLAKKDVQVVILGTGEQKYHDLLSGFAKRYPDKIAALIKFDNRLAHLIEAGSDFFLMPSRYEPCGLNQLYSLKYGTLPIVRETGGLADTIVDATQENIKAGSATGFMFEDYSADALLGAVVRALNLYSNKKSWKKLVKTAMSQDWSWGRSATEYSKLYKKAIEWKG